MSLGNEISAVALQYGEVAADATSKATFGTIEITGAEETTVSSFKAISDSMSAFSAPPTVATLSSMASEAGQEASTDARAKMSALTDGETPVDATPEVPGVPETPAAPAAPTAPAFTLPTMAQVSAASTQAAKMSGQASQQMNLVNQTMGSVQQVASMGQQGRAPAAPAEETAPADEGAGAGTEGAERAPIDDVGAARAESPGSAGRVL
jgi:hypothetical protein